MRILVTGGSSFVGANFCRHMARSHDVVALYHSVPVALNGVTALRVDLRRERDVNKARALNADAVVHIACKIKALPLHGETPGEAARTLNRHMMDAVLALGLPTLYASSTVVHWQRDIPYRQSRLEDEQRLQDSGLAYSIVRPSAPYGPRLADHRPGHKESFHTLVEMVGKLPFVPIIGDGKYRRQPLHVDDFSAAMGALLERGLDNKAYDAGGSEALSMDDVVDTIARAMGRQVRKLHLPKVMFVKAARFVKDFDAQLLDAADEDEVADPTALSAATGVDFRSFGQGVKSLL